MSFSNPGHVKVYAAGDKKRYYFGRTVGDSRVIAFTELKKRIEEGLYTGTDRVAAQAIIDNVIEQAQSEAAHQFLTERKYMSREGFTSIACVEYPA